MEKKREGLEQKEGGLEQKEGGDYNKKKEKKKKKEKRKKKKKNTFKLGSQSLTRLTIPAHWALSIWGSPITTLFLQTKKIEKKKKIEYFAQNEKEWREKRGGKGRGGDKREAGERREGEGGGVSIKFFGGGGQYQGGGLPMATSHNFFGVEGGGQ